MKLNMSELRNIEQNIRKNLSSLTLRVKLQTL
jgi:hypothetical protein